MALHTPVFVRTEMVSASPAPAGQIGTTAWVRKNLIATPKDVVLTLLALAFLAYVLPGLINWLFVHAVWSGAGRIACLTVSQGGPCPMAALGPAGPLSAPNSSNSSSGAIRAKRSGGR